MLIDNKNCTACGVCLNSCPQNAITMSENEYGFLSPKINETLCINCGLCNSICQKLNDIDKNTPQNVLAIQSKDIDINNKSASGGMFSQLAKFVLNNNGVVFGCAMKKKGDVFVVQHIAVTDEKDLYQIQGSKYIQSYTNTTYQKTKDFLDENRLVLYSGTPCQIAGLKVYLKKDYNNLISVDLSCTGVPSAKMFNDYVKFLELKFKHKIKEFNFRDKKLLGWRCGCATITFENNKKKVIYNFESAYLNLFINGGIHREACYNCKYTGTKRISDVTLADCWGIEQEYPELIENEFQKDKGISLVLINTEKGQKFYDYVQDNLLHKTVSINLLKKYNGPLRKALTLTKENQEYLELYKREGYLALEKKYKEKLGYKYYINVLKNIIPKFVKNFIKLFYKKEAPKLDCVLKTCVHFKNYGAILTGYALKKAINNLGFSAKIIKSIYDDKTIAAPFNKKYKVYTDATFLSIKDYKKLKDIANAFILGSDNQLNLNKIHKSIYLNLGFYLPLNMKKAVFSGSMSLEKFDAPEIEINTMGTLLNRFDYVSLREYNGIDILKNSFDCDADWLIDPIFLLKKEEYFDLADNSGINAKGKIMSYILYPTKQKNEILNKIKQIYNKDIIDFAGNFVEQKSIQNKNIAVEDWLKSIIDAEFIITDSYHCICFALLFNKPFICLKNHNQFIRFESLFKLFNLSNVITENKDNIIIYNLDGNNDEIFSVIDERKTIFNDKLIKFLSEPKIITEKQKKAELDLKKISIWELYNKFWYKENKFFYYLIVIPILKSLKAGVNMIKWKK